MFALLDGMYRLLYWIYEEIRFRLYYGPVFHRFLNHKYAYYSKLPRKLKMRFLRLVRDHYEYFEFVSRDQLRLTRAMKAIICSGASQLVMFLPSESLTFFTKIIIYPDYYSSKITHRVHKGEVNPGFRIIVFSWRGVMEGLQRTDDGLNLMLHEFAHALWLEHKLMSHEYTVLDEELVDQFELFARQEMVKMGQDENHFLRKYALTNMEEFFAVSVENFFERSESFRSHLPHLYSMLAEMFRQDPLKISQPTPS